MPLRTRLLVFGYPALELLTAWAVASLIGWDAVLLIVIGSVLAGILVMRAAGRAAFRTWNAAARTGTLPEGDPGRHALMFLAGLLIAIPGLWTTLTGVLLLLPPVQALLRPRFARWFGVQPGRVVVRRYGTGDVVQGTVISEPDPQTPTAGPEGPAAIDD